MMPSSSLFSASTVRRLLVPLLSAGMSAPLLAGEPIYQNDFEKAEPGPAPKELMVISGVFSVKEEGGNKFLELPGAPLDSFSALFGANPPGDAAASARFHGTKKGRKFPTFAISLNGVGGYRLQMSPAKKALEIYKGDSPVQTVPFEWVDNSWTQLRIQLRKAGDGCVVEGKAWAAGTPEPAEWSLKFEDKAAPAPGRAGIWGSPYSGTPIRFDDLLLEPLP